MATCNTNDLLAANPCAMGLSPFLQQVASLALWCSISENINPVPPVVPPGGLWNPEASSPIDGEDGDILVNPES